MKKILALLAAAALVLAVTGAMQPGAAAPTRAYDNEDIHCDVAQANDLHITYYSDTRMTLVSHFDGGFPGFVATPSPDGKIWECTWSGQNVVFCQFVHVGVEFLQETWNRLHKRDIYWTLNGGPVVNVPRNGPGFEVLPPEGPNLARIRYRLFNDGTIRSRSGTCSSGSRVRRRPSSGCSTTCCPAGTPRARTS
jgi:hypothetical protein